MYDRRSIVSVVALCSLFMAAGLLAQEAAETPREAAISANRVDWQPAGEHERLVLTVAGPDGLYLQREFGAGEAPFLSSPESALPDGIYAYELRAEGREVQWGHLWVKDGSFMDKTAAAPRSLKPAVSESKPRNITAETTISDDLIVEGDTTLEQDLIVKGHACIGESCTAVGAAPLIIKEVLNYQIIFDGSQFLPWERRWAIQANDANATVGDFLIRDLSGSKIPFRIGANAPDNSLTVYPVSGNIGVGTLTPAVRLDVKADAAGQVTARLQNSSATGHSGIHYLDSAGNVDLYFGLDNAASTTRLDSVNNTPLLILTNSVERIRVTSTGNVGVGTSTPAEKLHVVENVDANTILTVENSNTGSSAAGALRAKSDSAFGSFAAHGSGRTLSRFGQTLGGWGELLQATGNGLILGTLADKPLILGTNSANRVQITAAGSIGVGTTSPASLFHVSGGDIRVSGGSFIDDGTTLNVPDYVFEPDYRLMPLDELREFVSREKHLPNVPSASEVKKEGLNLSQVQMRLLEKVEELTLYTLKQDEHVKALQSENAKLNARLQALEQATAAEQQ